MIEVEDKFRVHPAFVLPDLRAAEAVAAVSPPRQDVLTAVYHDTADLRLAREGITLRHRTETGTCGWQLKLPVPGAPAGVRDEIHEDGPGERMPERLRGLVTAYVRRAELHPRATLTTDRTTYDLLSADGTVLAELVDDRVDAVSEGANAAQFREIEVEDRAGGSAVLDAVGAVLRDAGAVAGEFQPKVVRALGVQATAPAEPPQPQPVEAASPVRLLIAAVLQRHVRRLLAHDVGVRLDADDAVHQMRVAARRLRSALRDVEPLLDPAWGQRLQDELRWLGGSLGAGRDTEVVTARLLSSLAELPADSVVLGAGRRLSTMLDADAAGARGSVESALHSERYLTLLEDLVDAATHPRTDDAAELPCAEVLPDLFDASWRRLAKRAKAAQQPDAEPAALHKARIAAKRTRYLVGAMGDVYGRPAERLEGRLKDLQDVLGEHQDAMAAMAVLRRAALEPRVGRAAFTYGVLHGREEQAAARARAEFHEMWPRLSRRKHRRWAES